MIQPRHLIDVVAALLNQKPTSLVDLHAQLLEMEIDVPIEGLRHVIEGSPVRFRRVGTVWALIGQPVAKGLAPPLPAHPSLPNQRPRRRARSSRSEPSARGACVVCGFAHPGETSCSLTDVWR